MAKIAEVQEVAVSKLQPYGQGLSEKEKEIVRSLGNREKERGDG